MLDPDSRSLYTTALTPPPGYLFDEAIATTFSLDPTTLLTVPVHLALAGRAGAHPDGLALLEAMRRVTERLTVYVERGRVLAPTTPHLLYGLLEPILVEAVAPRDGAFHPKLWLLRFRDPDGSEPPLLRLVVLSRNLTSDRSWDLSLQLEGSPSGAYVKANRALGELLRDLPHMATGQVSDFRREQATRLGDEVRRTRWELPKNFDEICFHVTGLGGECWRPPKSKELVVISPFVTGPALRELAATTSNLLSVVSRSDQLDCLSLDARCLAKQWHVLDEAAETEDGEAVDDDASTSQLDTVGLHAKAYVARCGWQTHLFVGSANATTEALVADRNVELLVELVGKRARVGGADQLLGPEGLGPLLRQHAFPESPCEAASAEREAEDALERARKSLGASSIVVQCLREDQGCSLHLSAGTPVDLSGIATIRAWPLTVLEARAVDVSDLGTASNAVELGTVAVSSVTGLIAFELRAAAANVTLRFALNLPVAGLPDDRDAEILRTIINNRDGFLRYLLLLLGETAAEPISVSATASWDKGSVWSSGMSEDAPLLEELARAYCRDPERLQEVARIVTKLRQGKEADAVIPVGFLELWNVFAESAGLER